MSSFDYSDPGTDPAYCDGLSDPRPNARCADCHDDIYVDPRDVGPARCHDCWDRRDAHTSALEAASDLKRMAKAVLSADLTAVKEIA